MKEEFEMKLWHEYSEEELELLPKLSQETIKEYDGEPPFVFDNEYGEWINISEVMY